MRYELFYLIGESKEPKLDQIKSEIKNIVTGEGGVFQEPEISEKRKMAYKIKEEQRGTYIAQRFEFSNDSQAEQTETVPAKGSIDSITKKLNLNQEILRFIIVKASELPELKAREAVRREDRRVYSKKSAPVKKEDAEKKPVTGKETKSLDEKLEEILNI